jgi:hypothetical protein
MQFALQGGAFHLGRLVIPALRDGLEVASDLSIGVSA